MSVLGVSSYFLWSQKGTTVLPLVRGSGFLVSFAHSQTFYHHHVLSAAHVACPVRYRSLYGNTIGLKAIGERHVSTRMLAPDPVTGAVRHAVDLQFRQHFLPNVDVVSLRCTDESNSLPTELTPFELDESGLIEEGTELILCGMEAVEERANPNDDGLTLVKREIDAVCKAALVSPDYGTVCLTTLETATADGRTIELPLSMCGGPVLRKSSRKCVGVIVARAVFAAPPRDTHLGSLYQDPYLDLSAHGMLADAAIKAAFVPVAEFHQPLRRTEL